MRASLIRRVVQIGVKQQYIWLFKRVPYELETTQKETEIKRNKSFTENRTKRNIRVPVEAGHQVFLDEKCYFTKD